MVEVIAVVHEVIANGVRDRVDIRGVAHQEAPSRGRKRRTRCLQGANGDPSETRAPSL
jgi:hypothetical protein